MGLTLTLSLSADKDRDLGGKSILIVEGSLLAGAELADVFRRAGAHVHLTTNIINAYNLLRREAFDGAVVDQGRHTKHSTSAANSGTSAFHISDRLRRPTPASEAGYEDTGRGSRREATGEQDF